MTHPDCRTSRTPALVWVLGMVSGFALIAGTAQAQPANDPPAADAADPPAAEPAAAPPAEAPATEAAPAAEGAPEAGAPEATDAASQTGVVVEGGSLFEDGGASSTETEAATSTAAAPALPFELNGYVRGDVFIGKETRGDSAVLRAGYGELALQFRTARQEYGDAFAETRFRYGLQDDGGQDIIVDLR